MNGLEITTIISKLVPFFHLFQELVSAEIDLDIIEIIENKPAHGNLFPASE